jgi:hypothetical protein
MHFFSSWYTDNGGGQCFVPAVEKEAGEKQVRVFIFCRHLILF